MTLQLMLMCPSPEECISPRRKKSLVLLILRENPVFIDDVLLLLLNKFHVVLVTPESSAKDDGGTALSANKPRKTRKTTWKDNNTVKVKALNSELAIEGMTRLFCAINI